MTWLACSEDALFCSRSVLDPWTIFLASTLLREQIILHISPGSCSLPHWPLTGKHLLAGQKQQSWKNLAESGSLLLVSFFLYQEPAFLFVSQGLTSSHCSSLTLTSARILRIQTYLSLPHFTVFLCTLPLIFTLQMCFVFLLSLNGLWCSSMGGVPVCCTCQTLTIHSSCSPTMPLPGLPHRNCLVLVVSHLHLGLVEFGPANIPLSST